MADSLSAIFKKRSTPPQIRPQLKSQKYNTREGCEPERGFDRLHRNRRRARSAMPEGLGRPKAEPINPTPNSHAVI